MAKNVKEDRILEKSGISLCGVDLKKSFRDGFVLDIKKFEVSAGEIVAVLGPSGSGKSTLLSILGLMEKPDSGQVYLDGNKVDAKDRNARLKMAAVLQRPYLFSMTVGENVAYGLKRRDIPKTERNRRVAKALERVGLSGWEKRLPSTLSGGEAQRVSLARALVLRPGVLLLDEPLAALDPLTKSILLKDISEIIREEKMTSIYITHDLNEASAAADKLFLMCDGKEAAYGDIEDLISLPPDEWTADFLGVSLPVEGVVRDVHEGIMEIEAGKLKIFAPGSLAAGEEVIAGIPPDSILLFEGDIQIPESSARNLLTSTVVEIRRHGVISHVILDAGGNRILACASRYSIRNLNLVPGKTVQALFKAASVRVKKRFSDKAGKDAGTLKDSSPVFTNLSSGVD